MSKNGKVRRATEEKRRRNPVRTPRGTLVGIFNDWKIETSRLECAQVIEEKEEHSF